MRRICILFITFIFYAFLGWCFEMIHMGITTNEVVNRGFLNGPIIPIYGAGVLSILLLLKPLKHNIVLLTICIVLICSIIEYLTSYVMEKMFGLRWWDYENKPLNLHGRICFETMSMFTVMALFIVYYLDPVFQKMIDKVDTTYVVIISIILLIFFISDIIFSNMILNDYIRSQTKTKKKDKTPSIRDYTTKLLRDRF